MTGETQVATWCTPVEVKIETMKFCIQERCHYRYHSGLLLSDV